MSTAAAQARVAALLAAMETAHLPCFVDCGPLGVNTCRPDNDTPLIVVLIREDLQSTLDLLAAGADPNAVGEDGFTPLHWAARAGPAFVRPLLDHGAVQVRERLFGETPSDIARRLGDPELIALLGAGPDE